MSALKKGARRAARHVALDGLSAISKATGRLESAMARPRVHFVYLHDLPPTDEEALRGLVRRLVRTHTLITYSEAVDRVNRGHIDRPFVSFSFDDGFLSNLRAARILEEYGTTGCFFIPTGFVGTSTVAEARAYFKTKQGVNEPAMTWDDLGSLKSRGHEIGSHTVSHSNLALVSPQRVVDEIEESNEILSSHFGSCDHFAWPLGRFSQFSPQAARVAYNAGHTSCASAERGAHTDIADGGLVGLCIRREHVLASWPLRHALYFMAKSSANAGPDSNAWPTSLGGRDEQAS